ncbi:MAG: 50S ribosomal protein L9 [bacterium]
MKVILLKNVNTLGQAGDVKEVNDGYARNFLLAKKLAILATPENIANQKKEKEQLARKAEVSLLLTEKIAEKLNGTAVEIMAKVNEAGRLYASVTSSAILKKLKDKGFELQKNNIILPEPIKEPGEFKVTISLDHGLEAEIIVVVSE